MEASDIMYCMILNLEKKQNMSIHVHNTFAYCTYNMMVLIIIIIILKGNTKYNICIMY